MSIESRELVAYAENNGELYRQRIQPVIKNLALKKLKGIYDPVKALKLWKYVAGDAAQRYTKEFDVEGYGSSYGIFTVADRKQAAEKLAESYQEQIDGYFDDNPGQMPKKYRAKNPGRARVHTAKFDRCVKAVRKKGGNVDPYAVCMASIGERGSIKAQHRRKNPILGKNKLPPALHGLAVAYSDAGHLVVVRRKRTGSTVLSLDGSRYITPHTAALKLEQWYAAHRQKNPAGRLVDIIRHGDRVTIVDRFGQQHTGKAVMRSSHGGWVLNMGGRHGTPGLADDSNIVRVSPVKHTDSLAMRRLTGLYHNPVSGYHLVAKHGTNRVYQVEDTDFVTPMRKAEAKVYGSVAAVQREVTRLTKGRHLKPGWRFAAVTITRQNPVQPGERLYEDFHGEPPRHIKRHTLPSFRQGVEVGPLVAVVYDTIRDGKKIRFEHEFKKRASPLLTVSDDGRKIAVIGGDFRFTDRGFVDTPK